MFIKQEFFVSYNRKLKLLVCINLNIVCICTVQKEISKKFFVLHYKNAFVYDIKQMNLIDFSLNFEIAYNNSDVDVIRRQYTPNGMMTLLYFA